MKTRPNLIRTFYALSTTLMVASCQKNDVATNQDTVSNTIAVAATTTTVTGTVSVTADSVYLMQSCGKGGKRDSVAQTDLPAAAQTYIASTYAGSTFSKAFAIKNSSAAITGYVAVIYYNDKPVGLLFDSAGAFVRVLEQREKGDLSGPGHHRGGRFEHRDGLGRDTIALSSLPASITAYFSANYATDTVMKALRGKDSSIVVLSKNGALYATVFSATGNFVQRTEAPLKNGSHQSIELAALPSVVAAYLSQTYPNYVFHKAFSVSAGGTVKGYVVFIDANNTKYAVVFDASGNFVSVKTIH